MGTRYIGKSIPRLDGVDKVTGQAVYSVDVELPDMLHAAVLRSTRPHARIVELDVTGARTSPGVRAVVTGKDFPYTHGGMIQDQPFIAIDRVRYVGEVVAAVAAETERAAQAAVARIRVRYEDLPAVFDPKDAVADGAPLLHEGMDGYPRSPLYECIPGTNVCTIRTFAAGDVQAGFAGSDEVFDDEFYIHAVAHTPMETHAAAARRSPADGSYTVWSASDGPHRRGRELADALGLPVNKIQILSTYSGGGFGGKGTLVTEAIVVALAAFTGGRPVKMIFSREEELSASQTRHAAYMRLRTGVKRDGTLVARSADLLWDKGAYASKGPDVTYRGAMTIFGPYRIPNLEVRSRLVYTNKQIAGAYRGYGVTQVTWACEVQMDIIARRLGIDPVALRLKNCYVEDDRFINGQVMKGVGLTETLERAGKEIGWGEALPPASGPMRRGRGIAATLKGTATPTESQCLIIVTVDGSVTLLTSAVEVGAGQHTAMAQIAGETIGVDPSTVRVPNSDTLRTPYDFGTTSSRVTFHNGNAIRRAGAKARRRILEIAGEVLKIDPNRLSLADGRIIEEGVGECSGLREVLAQKFPRGGMIVEAGSYSPAGSELLQAGPGMPQGLSSAFWMFATHAVEVEVDTETGVVKVVKVAAAHDVGRAINPQLCEQQIEGSVVMGISNTLMEEFKLDGGRVLNNTLADYKMATMMDLPEIIPIIVEAGHPEGPFGAKGVGEPAAAPAAPAIANAVFDAIGVRIKDLPITPEKIRAALKERTG
ncbi:MAG: molybdopterin cofactor-binding domain-containing protein [Thermodesulfobacteriota bacterium]